MLAGLVVFLIRLIDFYKIVIIVWCILSWIPMRTEGVIADVARAIDSLVSPYISLFRRFIPPFGGLDFSPILAIVVLELLQRLILGIL